MFVGFARFNTGWSDPEGIFWAPDDLTYCRPNGSNLEMFSHWLSAPDAFQFLPKNVVEPIDLQGGQFVVMTYVSDKPNFMPSAGRKFEIDSFDAFSRNQPWILQLDALPGEKDLPGFSGGTCYITRLRLAEDRTLLAGPHKCTCDNFVLFARGCQCGGV